MSISWYVIVMRTVSSQGRSRINPSQDDGTAGSTTPRTFYTSNAAVITVMQLQPPRRYFANATARLPQDGFANAEHKRRHMLMAVLDDLLDSHWFKVNRPIRANVMTSQPRARLQSDLQHL